MSVTSSRSLSPSPTASLDSSSRPPSRSSEPSSTSSTVEKNTHITRWILDTRSLWPGENILQSAPEFLHLVSEVERQNILRKYHVADARLSLASALLKRAYIAQVTDLPWSEIQFSKRGDPEFGKPCWSPPKYNRSGRPWPKVDFNVSHQAGLAALVGICVADGFEDGDEEPLVGCDVVAPNERSDFALITNSDFEDFTSAFSEIFSSDELFDITYNIPSVTLLNGRRLRSKTLGRLDRTIVCDRPLQVTTSDGRHEEFSSDLVIDAKLRRFYTFFCLKEAYIKLVGEGLLAPWIRECEFRNVNAPLPGTVARCSTLGAWGGRITGGRSSLLASQSKDASEEIEIWLHGEELYDVRTDVQAFEEDYMIATMLKPTSCMGLNPDFPAWANFNLNTNVLQVAMKEIVDKTCELLGQGAKQDGIDSFSAPRGVTAEA